MTAIKIVFEFDIPKGSNVMEKAERLIKEYAISGDPIKDVADIYVNQDGKWEKIE